ncbi:TetR/AcrR family transcriptional regulator [Fusibacter ferrireducens]|nr:TetR/AcrR family transcriptional regulator [Fusibacter ferrireducens]
MSRLSENQLNKRKQNIIEAAFEVFAEKGYNAASMADIVQKSGVSKGGIYHYFKSKEDIFFAIGDQRFELRKNALEAYGEHESVQNTIRLYLTQAFDNMKSPDTIMSAKFSFEFWTVCTRDEAMMIKAQNRYEKYDAIFVNLLKRGVESGEIKKAIDLKGIAFLLLSTLDGITYTHVVMGATIPKSVINMYVDMMMHTIFDQK